MKRLKTGLLAAALAATFTMTAGAAVAPRLTVDGNPLVTDVAPIALQGTTYVPLRAVTQALAPDAQITWEGGYAVVQRGSLTLSAKPGEDKVRTGTGAVAVPLGVRLEAGRVLLPVRVLVAFLGGSVTWDPVSGTVHIERNATQSENLDPDEVYWLSRIISAESQGEPMEGKIAVGNVVLNRVQSPDFPGSIYAVIFDPRYGGQFAPVRNGTVYLAPTAESVLAAERCLRGENVVGKSLYFLAPALTDNHWTMENRPFVTTIGAHWFYE